MGFASYLESIMEKLTVPWQRSERMEAKQFIKADEAKVAYARVVVGHGYGRTNVQDYCSICHMGLPFKAEFVIKHLERIHLNKYALIYCTKCKRYLSRGELGAHYHHFLRWHRNSEPCPICKMFIRASRLKKHMARYHKIRPKEIVTKMV